MRTAVERVSVVGRDGSIPASWLFWTVSNPFLETNPEKDKVASFCHIQSARGEHRHGPWKEASGKKSGVSPDGAD
jgi:hypothetical protein